MIAERIPAIGQLSSRDKYILANELWAEIEADESSVPFDDAVVALLEKRHREYLDDPSQVVSWDEVKATSGRIPAMNLDLLSHE